MLNAKGAKKLRRPLPQELYRHFKGGKYQVITIARDADTGEEIVVYQALYGEFTTYCRPLSEFVSEVDTKKYPNADQKMRFELFTPEVKEEKKESASSEKKENAPASKDQDEPNKGDFMSRTIEQEAEEFGMNPLVVKFLDADSSADRLEVLNQIRPIVTNEMIDVMAMAIDTEIPGDDPDVRCGELRECLITKQRFEVIRLR